MSLPLSHSTWEDSENILNSSFNSFIITFIVSKLELVSTACPIPNGKGIVRHLFFPFRVSPFFLLFWSLSIFLFLVSLKVANIIFLPFLHHREWTCPVSLAHILSYLSEEINSFTFQWTIISKLQNSLQHSSILSKGQVHTFLLFFPW